jgi:chromosomal replication initiator protein
MASLSPRYTFSTFIVGASNELAAAAASAVAAAPGRAYNPLFIHGETGLGKTHLMQAIAHEARSARPELRVLYQTAHELLDACLRAIAAGQGASLADAYRGVDVLLVDDVHSLARRPDAQGEFAHVFAALTARGAQVVLTSDRPPGESGIESSMVRRFTLGRVVRLGAPSWEHRLAILQAKRAQQQLEDVVSRDVLEFVAARVTTNVRALEGAITRLVARARLTGAPLSVSLAQQMLREHEHDARPDEAASSGAPHASSVQAIARAVAGEWGTTAAMLQGRRRTKAVSDARHVAMYLARVLLHLPLAEIGREFGARDHSTVLHAVAQVERLVAVDPELRRRVAALRASLAPALGAAERDDSLAAL